MMDGMITLTGLAADFTPLVGEGKGFYDAYQDPSPLNIAAAIPIGGRIAKLPKAADKLGGLVKAAGKIDANWQNKIEGFAQKTGKDSWHADASYEIAKEYAKDPSVARVVLNGSLDKALGTKGQYNVRPDVTVIYKDGRGVITVECKSACQNIRKIDEKNAKIEATGTKNGQKIKADKVERGGSGDLTGGNATGTAPDKQNYFCRGRCAGE
jgi:hypothetical protein